MSYIERYITLEEYQNKYIGMGNHYQGFVIGYGYITMKSKVMMPPNQSGYNPTWRNMPPALTHNIIFYEYDEDRSVEAIKLSLRGLFVNGEVKITIRSGMTLSRIASLFDVAVSDLVDWNNIENPDRIMVGQKIVIRDNKKVPDLSKFVNLTVEPRDHGEIRPYEPNFWGMIEEWFNSPTDMVYLPGAISPSVGTVVTKFAGRVLYGILDDAWITLQCFTIGHANATHLNRSFTVGQETVNAGVNTLVTLAPFGKVNSLRQSGVGVMNGAQFNKYFKGTGINSAKQNGLLIRHYNYIERDAMNFKRIDDMNKIMSSPIVTLINENR